MAASQSAVTVGNFDGCHVGHRALVKTVIELGATLDLSPTAISFSPRPEEFFRGPQPHNESLFTPDQRERALRELGIENVITIQFNDEFSKVSRERFLSDFLADRLGAKAVVVGADFCFGHQRAGNTQWLLDAGRVLGIDVRICPPVLYQGDPVSSTRIRTILRGDGDVQQAATLLGRPYLLEGTIVKGNQLGRTLGFPTANLGDCRQLSPKPGVYFGQIWLAPKDGLRPSVTMIPRNSRPAVFNIGYRPTIESETPTLCIEGHIIDGRPTAPDSLYEMRAGYYLAGRIRDERRFGNKEDLASQIAADVEFARSKLF